MRFELNREGEMSVAALRLLAGVMVSSLALFLLLEGTPPAATILLGLAILVSVAWFVVGINARRRLGSPERWQLEVLPHALRIAQGGALEEIGWKVVQEVESDEELLVIRIQRADGTELRILPVWRGDKGPIGLHDLAEVIRDAWEDANRSDDG